MKVRYSHFWYFQGVTIGGNLVAFLAPGETNSYFIYGLRFTSLFQISSTASVQSAMFGRIPPVHTSGLVQWISPQEVTFKGCGRVAPREKCVRRARETRVETVTRYVLKVYPIRFARVGHH
jgi:hypothetical protein